jgi:hypothetical protein
MARHSATMQPTAVQTEMAAMSPEERGGEGEGVLWVVDAGGGVEEEDVGCRDAAEVIVEALDGLVGMEKVAWMNSFKGLAPQPL